MKIKAKKIFLSILSCLLTLLILLSSSQFTYAEANIIDLAPYRNEINNNVSANIGTCVIGGTSYSDAFLIGGHSLSFNLNGNYNEFTFSTGCRDNSQYGGAIEIHGDGMLLKTVPRQQSGSGLITISVATQGIKILQVVGAESYVTVIALKGIKLQITIHIQP